MSFEANAVFDCDALTLLERLPSAVVTLAYLDPPWNTGSAFGQNAAKRTAPSDQQYAIYLSKVVQQVHRVLTNAGSLFVHWSPVSPLDVRLVMNQAFGEQPRYEITWHKKGPHYQPSKGPKLDNELVLVYSKPDGPIYNAILRPLSAEEKSAFVQSDGRGPYLATDLTVPFDRPTARFTWRGYQPPLRRSWRFTLDKLEVLAQESRILFPPSGGIPRLKRYLDEHAGVELGTTWEDIPAVMIGRERTGYPGQRPLILMERIVKLASNEGDLVLDPFFGSGTTLVVAQSLGRRWWGADDSAEAHQITAARLLAACASEAGKHYAVYENTDVVERPVADATYRDVLTSGSCRIYLAITKTAGLTRAPARAPAPPLGGSRASLTDHQPIAA